MEDKNRGLEDYSMFLLDDRWYLYSFHVEKIMGVTPSSQNAPGFNLQFSLSSTLGKISQINPQLPPEKCWCTSKLMKKKSPPKYLNWWPGYPNNPPFHLEASRLQRCLAVLPRHLRKVDLFLEDPGSAATHAEGLPGGKTRFSLATVKKKPTRTDPFHEVILVG